MHVAAGHSWHSKIVSGCGVAVAAGGVEMLYQLVVAELRAAQVTCHIHGAFVLVCSAWLSAVAVAQ